MDIHPYVIQSICHPDLNQAQKIRFSWKMTNHFTHICFNIYYLKKFYLNEILNL